MASKKTRSPFLSLELSDEEAARAIATEIELRTGFKVAIYDENDQEVWVKDIVITRTRLN